MKFEFREAGGVLVAEPSGFLGGHLDSYEFLDALRSRIAGGTGKVVVNLAGVTKVNSSGIGILAALLTSAMNAKTTIRFACMSDHMWKIVSVVGLGRVIVNYATVEEALSDL
jgi:anti-sigma B factor antagonist